MLVKAQAAATAARRLKRKVEEEEEELANLAVKIIERADQVEVLEMEPCRPSLLCRQGCKRYAFAAIRRIRKLLTFKKTLE